MKHEVILKIFPALNGDSLLVSVNNYSILIDSGYVDTYVKFIKPTLTELAANRNKLDLLVVTHIDADHISGAIKFLSENNSTPIISIANIWHNSYRNLNQFNSETTADSLKGKNASELAAKSILKQSEVLVKNISAPQGSSLATLIQKGNYPWNADFEGGTISVENRSTIELNKGIKLTLLSPNTERLRALSAYWKKELFKLGYKIDDSNAPFDDAFEFIIGSEKEHKRLIEKNVSGKAIDLTALSNVDSMEDDRVSNGSSIAFFLEEGGRRMLFLGDSHPSVIVASLKRLFKTEEFPIMFDVIKVSHHGSIQNTTSDLLSLIDSPRFIVSTNGQTYNHPNIETIAKIVTRKSASKRTIYFNYPTEISSKLNDEKLMTQFNYDVVIGDGKTTIDLKF